MCRWFASFFEKALVSRVNRRIPIRIERFWRYLSSKNFTASMVTAATDIIVPKNQFFIF